MKRSFARKSVLLSNFVRLQGVGCVASGGRIISFLAIMSLGFFSTESQAVDFTIDLPRISEEEAALMDSDSMLEPIDSDVRDETSGFENLPNRVNNAALDGEEIPLDSDNGSAGRSEASGFDWPLPDPPIPLVGGSLEIENQSKPTPTTIYETNAFPVPACLEPNVAFWKSVYRDVDTDEALIHDRDDLARVFGKIHLSGSSSQRKLKMDKAREKTEALLLSLASKIERGNGGARLSSAERELLGQFAASDRKPSEIRLAAGRLRIQSGLQTRFDEGVKRSLELMPMITQVLRKYDVPKDIVFLPHVESSYMKTARSKVGAVGLWQIMPGTMQALMGRHMVNKRTNPRIATEAAAKLLRQNHRMLKSWPLALTAYNHGPAGVARGVRATGSTDLCTIIANYNSRSFRFASSNFYAQFLAARHVALDKYRTLALSKTHSKVLKPLLAYAHREQVTE